VGNIANNITVEQPKNRIYTDNLRPWKLKIRNDIHKFDFKLVSPSGWGAHLPDLARKPDSFTIYSVWPWSA
jgi:hypothetical protein